MATKRGGGVRAWPLKKRTFFTLLARSLFFTSLLQNMAKNMALIVQKFCGGFVEDFNSSLSSIYVKLFYLSFQNKNQDKLTIIITNIQHMLCPTVKHFCFDQRQLR